MAKRKCKATTKAGNPCKTAPLTGENFCASHSDRETRERLGFGGAQPGSGRKKIEDPFDVAREAVRQKAELLIRPHFRALGYEVAIVQHKDGPELRITERPDGGAKVYGESKDGEIIPSSVEDLAAQIVAAEKLLDRLYGRPKVAVEHSGGTKVEIVDTTPIKRPEHATDVRALLDQAKASVN